MSKSLLLIGSGCVDTCVVFFSQGLALLLLGISLTGTVPIFGFVSNPVAITVITISSSRLSSITAPKIMFASGSTLRCTNSAAVFTSCNPKFGPPVILIIIPFAPSIELSSIGF